MAPQGSLRQRTHFSHILVTKGSFSSKGKCGVHISRRYVSCHMYRSPDTVLSCEHATRVWWLDYHVCGARKTGRP
jgi:hypothetical protein